MAHYLITGGAGFIGSHLADALLAHGHQVTIIDDLSTGKRENIPAKVCFVEGDINQAEKLAEALEGVEGCFHLAAIPSVTQSIAQWLVTHRVNQGGSVAVFEAAARRNIPVVYASSAAIYGDNANLPLSEDEQPKPLSPYGLDKLGTEQQAAIGADCLGLHSVGLRFFNIYGPRQDPSSPYSGVISIFMERLRSGKVLKIFGDGEQTRDFVYVGDVVRCLQAAMQALQKNTVSCAIYNVATGKQTSINQLANILTEISNTKVPKEYAPARAGEIRISYGENAKIINGLRVNVDVSVQEGLALTWDGFIH